MRSNQLSYRAKYQGFCQGAANIEIDNTRETQWDLHG